MKRKNKVLKEFTSESNYLTKPIRVINILKSVNRDTNSCNNNIILKKNNKSITNNKSKVDLF